MYDLKQLNEYMYSLKIYGENNKILYDTIQKLIQTSHQDFDTGSILFSAENVIPFKKYIQMSKISHNVCVKLIDDLTKQIIYLHKKGYGFYGFDINDILTIDNTFIFCNMEYLMLLNNDEITFTTIIKHPYFSNPEVFELTSLPARVNYKCSFYSLGLLIVYILMGKYLLVGNELKSSEEIDIILQPINNTKIYWFIKRCLYEDTNERKLLFI